MKNYFLKFWVFLSCILVLFFGCASVDVSKFSNIFSKPSLEWSLDECNSVIDYYTSSNKDKFMSRNIFIKLSTDDVLIEALQLNAFVVQALARKEAVQKRLSFEEMKKSIRKNLELYTNYTADIESGMLVKKSNVVDSLNTISFKVLFENNSDPFRPIEIDAGYEYFFLQNKENQYSRVVEIAGNYVDVNFTLDGFLNVLITFSNYNDEHVKLFEDDAIDFNCQLVFNALQDDPIVLEWIKLK
ncbi:MAG: hypothetical protein KJ799_08785 [Bacteroidetes bacterium]|nr:hypothetical protein [Bacteroidota bacterium]MBU1679422.1 hypothetical protein [Bacteroidota bacterium]MBU2506806.1 hypothetical protein [Bacteroidota bacterium]